MPQAILRCWPRRNDGRTSFHTERHAMVLHKMDGSYREPTILMNFCGNEKPRALRLSQKPPDPRSLPPRPATPRTKTQTRKPTQSQQSHRLTQMRVQNAYTFVGRPAIFLPAAAHVAHAFGLVYGFAVIGSAFVFGFLFAAWPARGKDADLVASG